MFAKKSLGQNFLKSKSAVADILKAADIQADDTILEIGPGKGVLTEALLQKAGRVVVVEKDDRLIPLLEEKFETEIANQKLYIIHQDILDFAPESNELLKEGYKVIANIPYYITGLLFRKFLENNHQPIKMVLMVQKEVAKRIVASDKKESILSLSVKAYGEPKYIKTVPARYFSPEPKVDSAILLINTISKNFFQQNKIDETAFFQLIKSGFAHKRKMLRGNLSLTYEKDHLATCLDDLYISSNARAEDIPLHVWGDLADHLKNQSHS